MAKMQFFYDYMCPYCKTGYDYLKGQIVNHPEIEVDWRPIESHPEPEDYSPHTNLVCQSYYIARELCADMDDFHDAMFRAILVDGQDVEKPEVLCDVLKDIVDATKFRNILDSKKYAKQVAANNDLAEDNGVWFVPAFRMNGKKLDAKGGVGIKAKELRDFLKG